MNFINKVKSERIARKEDAKKKAERSSIKKILKDFAIAIIIAICLFVPFYLIVINL